MSCTSYLQTYTCSSSEKNSKKTFIDSSAYHTRTGRSALMLLRKKIAPPPGTLSAPDPFAILPPLATTSHDQLASRHRSIWLYKCLSITYLNTHQCGGIYACRRGTTVIAKRHDCAGAQAGGRLTRTSDLASWI